MMIGNQDLNQNQEQEFDRGPDRIGQLKQMGGRARHTWLFLLEVAFAITLFAIAAAAVLSVFTAARKMQDQAADLHRANLDLQNVSELIRSTDSLRELESSLQTAYTDTEELANGNEEMVIGTAWMIPLVDGYTLEVRTVDQEEELYTFELTLDQKDGQLVEKIEIEHVMRQ